MWLYDAIREKLHGLKIRESEIFQYHVNENNNVRYLYLPSIPIPVVRDVKHMNLELVDQSMQLELKYNEKEKGFKIDKDLEIKEAGLCRIKNQSFFDELDSYLYHRKRIIYDTIIRFLRSYRKSALIWRNTLLGAQKGFIQEFRDGRVKLEIIEGASGTGKTEQFLRRLPENHGRILMVFPGDGGIKRVKDGTGDIFDIYVYRDKERDRELQQVITQRVHKNKSNDPVIAGIQDKWLDQIKQSNDFTSLFGVFCPAIALREREVGVFAYKLKYPVFDKIFIDDANQFHPWSILEIFPLSGEIVVAGDQEQLPALKDFEFLVHRLGLPDKSYKSGRQSATDTDDIPVRPMNLDEPFTSHDFVQGNLRRVARNLQQGLSFKEQIIERYKINVTTELENRIDEIMKYYNRSLLQIAILWPALQKKYNLRTTFYRYEGAYQDLLTKYGVIDGSHSSIVSTKIPGKIAIPVYYFDFPQGNVEETVGRSYSKRNKPEAELIHKYVQVVLEETDYSILVTSAYGEQINYFKYIMGTLEEEKKKLTIMHVNETSSLEADLVFMSLTRNNLGDNIGWMGDSRISMMLKRAKKAAIVVGSSETFKGKEEERKIITGIKREAVTLKNYELQVEGSQ